MSDHYQNFMNFVRHAKSTTMSSPGQLLGLDDPQVHVDIRVNESNKMMNDELIRVLRRHLEGDGDTDGVLARI